MKIKKYQINCEIIYLGWEITHLCDAACDYCFSFNYKHKDDLSLEQIKLGLRKIKKLGVKSINFCGGEPLMRKDFYEILVFAKNLGFETVLSTNGNQLRELLPKLGYYLDWISLTLAAADPILHDYFRGEGNYSRILELLDYINLHYQKVRTKINTVVTAQNIFEVSKIGKIISHNKGKWKLIQFSPRGNATHNRLKYEIEDGEFTKTCNSILSMWPELEIEVSANECRNNGCVIMNQKGDLLTPDYDKYHFLGNIFCNTSSEILTNISTNFSKLYEKVINNYNASYIEAKRERGLLCPKN
jgi:MoaA/NifB/PqqE/SkfB family radical SAM enzyme